MTVMVSDSMRRERWWRRIPCQLVNQLLEWNKFPLLNQIEFLDEKDKVLEGSVEVSFLSQLNNFVKVLMIDVCVDTEQSFKDCLGGGQKSSRKRNSDFGREKLLVIQLILDPSHQIVNVLRSRTLDRFLDGLSISPVILIFGTSGHNWTTILGAKFSNSSIQHVDLIKEINRIDSNPFVEVFSFG